MRVEIGGAPLLVASLSDIIRSKRAAKRPQDLAVLPLLEQARDEAEAAKGSPRRRPPRS
jgi:hypothetical protein